MKLLAYSCIVLLMAFLFISSCDFFDYEKAKSKRVIGNVFVANANLPEDSGYYLTFLTSGGDERQLLKGSGYVDYLKANDSLILVKTMANPKGFFYLIKHSLGVRVFSVVEIPEYEFVEMEEDMDFKFYFSSREELK